MSWVGWLPRLSIHGTEREQGMHCASLADARPLHRGLTLSSATACCRHSRRDKQSLKGIKRQKQAAGAAGPAAVPAAAAAEPPASGHAAEKQQQQPAGIAAAKENRAV